MPLRVCVLEREVVCVTPKKLLALVVAQHDEGNKADGIVRTVKGLGSFEKITGHDETRRISWDSMTHDPHYQKSPTRQSKFLCYVRGLPSFANTEKL